MFPCLIIVSIGSFTSSCAVTRRWKLVAFSLHATLRLAVLQYRTPARRPHSQYGLETLPCPSLSDTLNLATRHTIHERCLPSERGMDMDTILTDPVSGDGVSGTGVTADQILKSAVFCFTLLLAASVFAITQTSVTRLPSSADCTDAWARRCSDNPHVAGCCSGGNVHT